MELNIEHIVTVVLAALVLYMLYKKFQRKKFGKNSIAPHYSNYLNNSNHYVSKLLDHDVKIDCSGDLGLRTDNFEYQPREGNRCIVDDMNDEVQKFAVQSRCDCDKPSGCSVCTLKHSNDHVIASKLCQQSPTSFDCIVSAMENDSTEYMKKLMTGQIF